jgi:putative membrane protein
MMGYGGYEGFGGLMGGGLMILMMALIWIVPIGLVVWGVSGLRGGQRPSTRDETPLEILRRRYATGEISQEEFEQAKRVLA